MIVIHWVLVGFLVWLTEMFFFWLKVRKWSPQEFKEMAGWEGMEAIKEENDIEKNMRYFFNDIASGIVVKELRKLAFKKQAIKIALYIFPIMGILCFMDYYSIFPF